MGGASLSAHAVHPPPVTSSCLLGTLILQLDDSCSSVKCLCIVLHNDETLTLIW